MASLNKVLLIGNMTRDPQLTYLPSQTAVVDFGLAVNRRWTSRDGVKKEDTCFVDCRAFAGQAETINKYMSKGRPLFVEGRLTFESWTSQDGSRRSRHRVTVENFQFLPGGGGAGQGQRGRAEQEKEQEDPGAASETDEAHPVTGDDIPF